MSFELGSRDELSPWMKPYIPQWRNHRRLDEVTMKSLAKRFNPLPSIEASLRRENTEFLGMNLRVNENTSSFNRIKLIKAVTRG